MIVPMSCPYCSRKITLTFEGDSREQPCPECGKGVPLDCVKIQPGVIIGKGYRIDRLLDEDSQVQIFIATQEAMDRKVAIKIMPPDIAMDEEKLQRFQREVKLAATLEHSNILTAYGAGEDAGVHFLIKQYAPGKTLEELCLKNGKIPEDEAIKYLYPIAEALRYAWDTKKVIHRNIKPETILVSDAGRSLLMDLGIAKSVEVDGMHVTSAGFTLGTPEYMSPEQVRGSGDLDWRTDQYSLGIVLYRCVTGVVPFADPSTMIVMQKQIKEAPVPAQFKNPEVSTACSTVIDKMLAKNRDDRYSTWEDVIADFKALLKGGKPRLGREGRGGVAEHGTAATGKSNHKAGQSDRKRKSGAAKPSAHGAHNPKEAKAKGVSRQDVERIARDMYGTRNTIQKLLFYGLSILIPIGLVLAGFYYVNTTHRQERLIRTAYQDARNFAASNPTSFDRAIEKFEYVCEISIPGTEIHIEAKEGITALRIGKVLYELKQRSDALVREGKWKEAIEVFRFYNGPFMGETSDERERLAESVSQQSWNNP